MVDRDPPPGGPAWGCLVIRIERVSMPEGLRAIGHRNRRGDLIIYLSDALDAECARAAVQEVIRAARRAGWRTGLPPVGVALLVTLGQLLRGGATALRAQQAAWAAAATALAAGRPRSFLCRCRTSTSLPRPPGRPCTARRRRISRGARLRVVAARPGQRPRRRPPRPGRSLPARPPARRPRRHGPLRRLRRRLRRLRLRRLPPRPRPRRAAIRAGASPSWSSARARRPSRCDGRRNRPRAAAAADV